MLGMADEHISYGAVINPEVGPIGLEDAQWRSRPMRLRPQGAHQVRNQGIRGIGLPDPGRRLKLVISS